MANVCVRKVFIDQDYVAKVKLIFLNITPLYYISYLFLSC